ncbi:hypothetical protein [Mesorhizobium sp.]|uniref:hypothetical protein n=1 Tax=Mesorhizobium sp. TaxID=1871066 RepID=UPI00257FE244|nr:hypothetical protein [Mesorhizobium sp.]
MSGPEEGDKVDQTVLVCADDGTEEILIREGNLRKRKALGRRIAKLLNEADAEILR